MKTIEKYTSLQNSQPKVTFLASENCLSKTIEVPSDMGDVKVHQTLSVSTGDHFINILSGNSEITDMLIKAVNNRTRERNFFKIYCDLLDGTISEDEFDEMISENEDDYIVDETDTPNLSKITLALRLAKKIKGVETINDLSSLFSFNPYELEKCAALDF